MKVSGSPHIHGDESVKKIMWTVVLALLPAFLVSIFYFGLPALVLTLVSIASCVVVEYLVQRFLLKGKCTIADGSAVLTGLLLAFNVPANLPIPILIFGAIIAIGVVKMAFGGLGNNLFNPAVTARVVLLISFPVQMTTYPAAQPIWSFGRLSDVITGPTPLSILKEVKSTDVDAALSGVQKLSDNTLVEAPNYLDMLLGQMGGSFGEVSAVALLIGAIFLLCRKVITWHIPVAFLMTTFIFTGIFWLIDPTAYANPCIHLITGGLVLGACFMATDMVTSPVSKSGMLVFGAGCGLLTGLIRLFGAYPEGVSFAILLMNALVPLIDKAFKPKRFGVVKS